MHAAAPWLTLLILLLLAPSSGASEAPAPGIYEQTEPTALPWRRGFRMGSTVSFVGVAIASTTPVWLLATGLAGEVSGADRSLDSTLSFVTLGVLHGGIAMMSIGAVGSAATLRRHGYAAKGWAGYVGLTSSAIGWAAMTLQIVNTRWRAGSDGFAAALGVINTLAVLNGLVFGILAIVHAHRAKNRAYEGYASSRTRVRLGITPTQTRKGAGMALVGSF